MADVLDGLTADRSGARITVAWDVDDVLNDLMRRWLLDAWGPMHPGTDIGYEALVQNPPHELLRTSHEDYLRSLDEFRHSEFGRLAPSSEVLGWLARHGARCRHVALTATPRAIAPISAQWVMRHFGDWIRAFAFVPSPRDDDRHPRYDQSKGEALEWLEHIDVVVDDNEANVQAARALGRSAVLVPRPWNSARGTLADALEELLRVVTDLRRSAGAGDVTAG